MPVTLTEVVNALDEELQPHLFKDYCPNGLQVEGKKTIKKIITGVTACQALIDQAIEKEADAILVHHGYFWRGESAVITGMKKQRIETLLHHGISLIAYHLPLDAHPVLGNNAQLAQRMGWSIQGGMEAGKARPLGNWGTLQDKLSVKDMASQLENVLHHKPLAITGGDHSINRVAWCTGAAQSMIDQALALGADAFVSGEVSESTFHFARENSIHYFAAGHHATERYGVQALAQWVTERMDVAHQFIDIHSPV